MRVDATKQATPGRTSQTPRATALALAPAEHDTESRALVVQAAAANTFQPPANYRQAQFLAHLIAVKEQLPQTRERRRAEPGEAIAAYRAGEALVS